MEWHGLCPLSPSPPGQETHPAPPPPKPPAPSQESKQKTAGCLWGVQSPGGGWGGDSPAEGQLLLQLRTPPHRLLYAGEGLRGLWYCPHLLSPIITPWHFFICLSCLCVLCCPVFVCWLHVLCRPLPCLAPIPPLPRTLDPRPSCGAAKVPRMGPSRCYWTSLRTCR